MSNCNSFYIIKRPKMSAKYNIPLANQKQFAESSDFEDSG